MPLYPAPSAPLAPLLFISPIDIHPEHQAFIPQAPVPRTSEPSGFSVQLRAFFRAVVPPSRVPRQCQRHACPSWPEAALDERENVLRRPGKLTVEHCTRANGLVSGFQPYKGEHVWCETDSAVDGRERGVETALVAPQAEGEKCEDEEEEEEGYDGGEETLGKSDVPTPHSDTVSKKKPATAPTCYTASPYSENVGGTTIINSYTSCDSASSRYSSYSCSCSYTTHVLKRNAAPIIDADPFATPSVDPFTSFSGVHGAAYLLSTPAAVNLTPETTTAKQSQQLCAASSFPVSSTLFRRARLPVVSTESLLTAALKGNTGVAAAGWRFREACGIVESGWRAGMNAELPSVFSWSSTEDEDEEDEDEGEDDDEW